MFSMKRTKAIDEELKKIKREEDKIFNNALKPQPTGGIKKELEKKVPENLMGTLEKGFAKGFELVFSKGGAIIEKTYDKEAIAKEFELNNKAVELTGDTREINKLKNKAAGSNGLSTIITTIEGVGLGALGIGLPDIAIWVAMMLRGVYETALNYGFTYDTHEDKMFILKLIEASMQTREGFLYLNDEIDDYINTGKGICQNVDDRYTLEAEKEIAKEAELKEQIEKTAEVFATQMLVTKFIQGLPVVGIIGGATNPYYYQKVMKYVQLKYKKKYLLSK